VPQLGLYGAQGAVTLRVAGDTLAANATLKRVLRRHASRAELVSQQRLTGAGPEITYHLLLRDPSRWDELQVELSHTEAFENVSVFFHADETEI